MAYSCNPYQRSYCSCRLTRSTFAAGMGGTAAAAEEPVVTGAAAPAVTVLEPAKLPGGEATV